MLVTTDICNKEIREEFILQVVPELDVNEF